MYMYIYIYVRIYMYMCAGIFFSERLAMLPECFLGPSHRLTHQVSSILYRFSLYYIDR